MSHKAGLSLSFFVSAKYNLMLHILYDTDNMFLNIAARIESILARSQPRVSDHVSSVPKLT